MQLAQRMLLLALFFTQVRKIKMIINQKGRFAIAQALSRRTPNKIQRWTLLLSLFIFMFFVPSYSSYAMPQGLLQQPSQGSSYWVLGDLYTLKATGEDTNQAYALTEILAQPQSGTPLHRHSREDEAFYIQEGEVEFQLGEQTIVATAGAFLHSPKGQIHSYRNITSKPAKMLCWVMPAGLEKFFVEIGVPIEGKPASPPPISSETLKKVMATAPKYGLEIIPPPSPSV